MPRKTRGKTTTQIVEAARSLRGDTTRTEEFLWEALRGRKLAGLRFRRQHPYERFVLDFFCVEHQLGIEVDGGIHLAPTQATHDIARTEFLQTHGVRVLRFHNDEIENNLQAILQKIVAVTAASPKGTNQS